MCEFSVKNVSFDAVKRLEIKIEASDLGALRRFSCEASLVAKSMRNAQCTRGT